MSDPLRDLELIALELAPCDTLLISPQGHVLGKRLQDHTRLLRADANALLERPQDWTRQRLALVADTLETLNPDQGAALIALLRDRLAETLYCLAMPAQCPAERMFALGLRPLGTYPGNGGGPTLYHFDLYDYKRTPDWLNARNWANPELWNKHRW